MNKSNRRKLIKNLCLLLSFCLVIGLIIPINNTKVLAAGADRYKAVASGEAFTVALKENGTVVAWGYNEYGQCDIPNGLSNVKSIAAGRSHAVALREDGTIVAWGSNGYGECDTPKGLSKVKAIAVADCLTVALLEDGTVKVWGNNDSEHTQYNAPKNLSNVKAITAYGKSIFALKNDGTVVGWGDFNTVPTGVTNIKSIVNSDNYVLALKKDGTVIAWGINFQGQCNIPKGLSKVKIIAAGVNHAVAIKENGNIIAWGTKTEGVCAIPKGLSKVKAVAAGLDFTVAIKEDGTLIAWGENSVGQCKIPKYNASSNLLPKSSPTPEPKVEKIPVDEGPVIFKDMYDHRIKVTTSVETTYIEFDTVNGYYLYFKCDNFFIRCNTAGKPDSLTVIDDSDPKSKYSKVYSNLLENDMWSKDTHLKAKYSTFIARLISGAKLSD